MLVTRWLIWGLFLGALASCDLALAGEGVVALQTAAPSCGDGGEDRYVDCGNGTVTDNRTGLVWLANANCIGALNWFEAMTAVAGLADLPDDSPACASLTPDECDCGLSDGSSPGDWRLPTLGELEAMVKHAAEVLHCSPTISSDSGNGCWEQACVDGGACSFHGVVSSWYWSSSTFLPNASIAWGLCLRGGEVSLGAKGDAGFPWAVRGGQ